MTNKEQRTIIEEKIGFLAFKCALIDNNNVVDLGNGFFIGVQAVDLPIDFKPYYDSFGIALNIHLYHQTLEESLCSMIIIKLINEDNIGENTISDFQSLSLLAQKNIALSDMNKMIFLRPKTINNLNLFNFLKKLGAYRVLEHAALEEKKNLEANSFELK